jgi:hypothetical protein
MLEKIDKIQALLEVPNVDADPKNAIANMKILNILVDLRAEAKQLILSGVVDSEAKLCGKSNCHMEKLDGNVYCSYHYDVNFG